MTISNSELMARFRGALIQAALGKPQPDEAQLEAAILKRMKRPRTVKYEPLPIEVYENVVRVFRRGLLWHAIHKTHPLQPSMCSACEAIDKEMAEYSGAKSGGAGK